MAKKCKKKFGSSLDPKDIISLAYDLPMCSRSKTPILLCSPCKICNFSGNFTTEDLKRPRHKHKKWPIFEAKHLFPYLSYQNDTYRGFSTPVGPSKKKVFLKLPTSNSDICWFSWFFPKFQKKWPKLGGLWRQKFLPMAGKKIFFVNFKSMSTSYPSLVFISVLVLEICTI